MKLKHIIVTSIIALAGLIATAGYAQRITTEDYIRLYKNDAIKDMVKTGVPACITLAQGIFESESGNSDLAREANNHFGIKCHKDWTGASFHKDDDTRDECFRKYKNALESFDDHSEFLRTRDRYASLFKLDANDYKGWAHGLKRAGYATNPHYASKLIELIERYNLMEINTEAIAVMNGKPMKEMAEESPVKKSTTEQRTITVHDSPASKGNETVTAQIDINKATYYASENNVKYIVSKTGDTWLSIAKENEMMLWQILKYNDVDREDVLRDGTVVYIKPKRNSASKEYHVVKAGETMRDISQMYAVKLNQLYKKNQIEPGTTLRPGDKIRLNN